jgi:hypothetical protein
MNKLLLNPIVNENLQKLIEIRDTVVHFYYDEALSYLVYALGVASLRNFQKLVSDWFQKSLLEYNFYILPLGFAYNFRTHSLLQFEQKPQVIANLISSVSAARLLGEQSDGFYFICEVTTKIVSAKKFKDNPDLVTHVDTDADPDAIIVERLQRLIDKYPLSYAQLCEKIKAEKPDVKQQHINTIIRDHGIKNEPRYSGYNFRTKLQSDQYSETNILPTGVPNIYNEDAVRYILAILNS